MTSQEIIQELKNKKYKPVYLLHGEEAYFIDKISDYITAHVLDESEKSFNLTILYGKDTDVETLISEAKRFPMMSDRQVVVLREAQQMKRMDELFNYMKNPLDSTLLVICHKYKKIDKRLKFVKEAAKKGVVFESKKIYDNQVAAWVEKYLAHHKKKISPKASHMLAEYLGTDLSRIVNELDKLCIAVGENDTIEPKAIEENIGLSKDFNNFELQQAIFKGDMLKANRIVNYFASNPRSHPLVVTLGVLYGGFSKLVSYHSNKAKSPQVLASVLGVNPYFVKDYATAATRFNLRKTVAALAILRDADLKSKGVGVQQVQESEILKELVFRMIYL